MLAFFLTMKNIIHKKEFCMNESILLENYEHMELKGATKVVSATATQIVVETETKNIIINGNNLEVTKLDLENNLVCLSGSVSLVKLGSSNGQKPSFFKRIFK